MGIMTNSLTFDKAIIANSYRAIKNFFATSATGLLGVDINNHSVKPLAILVGDCDKTKRSKK